MLFINNKNVIGLKSIDINQINKTQYLPDF